MNSRTIILLVVVFVLLVAGMFTFSFIKKQEMQNETPSPTPEEPANTDDVPYPDVTHIDAKHFFRDGTHTIAGEVTLPTPCDLLEVSSRVAESAPEQVTLEFTVINESDMCAQMITNQRFQVSVDASEDATFSADFMGRDVTLNLLEPAPGETPDDFELFIKG